MNERRCEQVGQVGKRQAQDIDAQREGAQATFCFDDERKKARQVCSVCSNHAATGLRRVAAANYYQKNKNSIKQKNKEWALSNREKVREYKRQWKKRNRGIVNASDRARRKLDTAKFKEKFRKYYLQKKSQLLQRRKDWGLKNRDHLKNYYKQRAKNSTQYRIAKNLRSRIRSALVGNFKTEKTENLIGCSFDFLKVWLESKWKPGMSWQNYGHDGWHIDHVRPISSFDLSLPKQQSMACHFLNLQPLWAHENFSKSDRY